MAAKPRKTWQEKLAEDKDLPKVITVNEAAAKRWGGRTIAIAAPREIDALMRRVPRGRVTTMSELRAGVAKGHSAESACPITTGIFAWIAAHAAEEARAEGEAEKRLTPYWRTLKKGGELNPKYPGGVPAQERRLAAEGHAFVKKGTRVFVRDLAEVLFCP